MKGKYLKLFLAALLTVVFIAFGTGTSLAIEKTGYFWASIEGSYTNWNDNFSGGGGGVGSYFEGTPPSEVRWFLYDALAPQEDALHRPNPQPQPIWWNQWYYDDPLWFDHWKKVTLDFDYWLNNPEQGDGAALITINWSTNLWSNESAPPMTNLDDAGNLLIGRQQVDSLLLLNGDIAEHLFLQTYDLRDYGVNYNPVWISIDVSGYNINLSSQNNPGSITHECIPTPEPATMTLLLLGLGLTGLAGWRRKFS